MSVKNEQQKKEIKWLRFLSGLSVCCKVPRWEKKEQKESSAYKPDTN